MLFVIVSFICMFVYKIVFVLFGSVLPLPFLVSFLTTVSTCRCFSNCHRSAISLCCSSTAFEGQAWWVANGCRCWGCNYWQLSRSGSWCRNYINGNSLLALYSTWSGEMTNRKVSCDAQGVHAEVRNWMFDPRCYMNKFLLFTITSILGG